MKEPMGNDEFRTPHSELPIAPIRHCQFRIVLEFFLLNPRIVESSLVGSLVDDRGMRSLDKPSKLSYNVCGKGRKSV